MSDQPREPRVESFDSLEAMFDTIATRHMAAMEQLRSWQRDLLPLREFYWMRVIPEMDIIVFGHHDLDASIELEKRLTPEEEMSYFPGWVEEFEHRNLENGFKYGNCYSVVEPEGELGSTHIATMIPITKEAFEEAKAIGWDIRRLSPDGALAAALERAAELAVTP